MKGFLLIAWTAVLLYGAACAGTMPKQCFTTKFAVKCQKIQVEAILDWRKIDWRVVQAIRVTG